MQNNDKSGKSTLQVTNTGHADVVLTETEVQLDKDAHVGCYGDQLNTVHLLEVTIPPSNA